MHAAFALVETWAENLAVPADLWPEVQELLGIYREHLSFLSPDQLGPLHIASLDEAMVRRVHPHFSNALNSALWKRIGSASEFSADFHYWQRRSFLAAFREAAKALEMLDIDHVPIQGSLISVLRYGSFPVGRLSEGKRDVVDNDAELMIILNHWEDWTVTGARISVALEALGWPPCEIPHMRKIVCLSLAHAIPCKVEIYVVFKDLE